MANDAPLNEAAVRVPRWRRIWIFPAAWIIGSLLHITGGPVWLPWKYVDPAPADIVIGVLLVTAEVIALWLFLHPRMHQLSWLRILMAIVFFAIPGLILADPQEIRGIFLTHSLWLILISVSLVVVLLLTLLTNTRDRWGRLLQIIFGVILLVANFLWIVVIWSTRHVVIRLALMLIGIGISTIAFRVFIRVPRRRIILFVVSILAILFCISQFFILVDCGHGPFDVVTWIDKNHNGMIDEGEPPFPDVSFGWAYKEKITRKFTTDSNGKGYWSGFGGCPGPSEVPITVVIPLGYQPTTPTTCTGTFDQPCHFGFIETQD